MSVGYYEGLTDCDEVEAVDLSECKDLDTLAIKDHNCEVGIANRSNEVSTSINYIFTYTNVNSEGTITG